MASQFAELLCRSHYSFLRATSTPQELVETAQLLGLRALALTDYGGVYGLPKAYALTRSNPHFKLITGAELPLSNSLGLILHVRNKTGYALLCKLITASHQNRPKHQPLLSVTDFDLLHISPSELKKGLITTLRICESNPPSPLDLKTWLDRLSGPVYTPLMRLADGRDTWRTQCAIKLQNDLGLIPYATTDARMHSPAQKKLLDVMMATQHQMTIKDAGFKLFQNAERHLKSPDAMAKLYRDLPQALDQALCIADQCTFSLSELKYHYPTEWIPKPHTAQSYLEHLTYAGAHERYRGLIPPQVLLQLKHELLLIKELGFADYFLTVYDIVEFAKSQNILCQGRGSAANSSVCFCLGITAIDPVAMGLLFERFISKERGEPPDIDVDFEHERREEVIQYIYKRYGRERAAMVSAVITYQSRSSLRDVAKALGLTRGNISAKKIQKTLETELGTSSPPLLLAQTLAQELKDKPRHLSIHSGGFILSGEPLDHIVPVEPATMPGRTIVQWDKYDLDILGLLKIDVLALGMLSAIQKTLTQTGLKLYQIPQNDPQTYEMIKRADTVGVFQIESRAQMSMLPRLKPEHFYDLVIEVALIRPGPIVGQMVHPYLKRRQGSEPITYPSGEAGLKMKSILGRTLGIPLFQEQVMRLAIELAGFSPGEADELRRAIGKWNWSDKTSAALKPLAQKLMAGLKQAGVSLQESERIFTQLQGFAEYGFPESHAASFALLAYASSYLKRHHTAAFTCALINSQPMGFYSTHTLIDDAKRHGVTILPIHPNLSNWDCICPDAKTLLLGFRVVQGMSQHEFAFLKEARTKQPFTTLGDFYARSRLKKDTLETLALGDAFSCFELKPRQALWELLFLWRSAGLNTSSSGGTMAHRRPCEPDTFEQIALDYRSFGLSSRGHPMQVLRATKLANTPFALNSISAVKRKPTGSVTQVAGLLIVIQKPPTAKGTVFATLEDESGLLDLIIWPKIYERYKDQILYDQLALVKGVMQGPSLIVQSLRSH